MARKVSAAVLAVEEFNIKLEKFTPLLTKMNGFMKRQALATEKMLDLQIEQTETLRRREEHDRVQPKVKDDKGKETTVVPDKKKDKKDKGGALNFIGSLGSILAKVALGGLVATLGALKFFDPIKDFVHDVISGFSEQLWNNIKEHMPGWIKTVFENTPQKVKDTGGKAAAGGALGFIGGRLIKAITKIPKLGRIFAMAGAGAGALSEALGVDGKTAGAVGGAAAVGIVLRKQIAKLMPDALKSMAGAAWEVAKKGTSITGKVTATGAKAGATAVAGATKGKAATGVMGWLGKKLAPIGAGAAKTGRTLAPILGWGPMAFLDAMTSVDSRDGVGQTLTDEQFEAMQNTPSLEYDPTQMWLDAQKRAGKPQNLYKFFSDQVQYETDRGYIDPLSKKDFHERVMKLAEEAIGKYPNAIIKPPADMSAMSPKPADPDQPMRLTIPPENTSENESEPRVYEESKAQTTRERRLAESTEKKNSKPSVVAMRGGNSQVRQGDKVNNVTNNYYSSVDPTKNLDPYRMGWA